MSTGLIVNILLVILTIMGLAVGWVARGEHQRNVARLARMRKHRN